MSTAEPSADLPRSRVVPRQQAVGQQTIRVGVPDCGASGIETHTAPDGRVMSIDVRCGCGEMIRILCQYQEPPQ